MSVLATVKDETGHGSADGQITLQVLGGMPPYAFIWNDGIKSQERIQLSQGIYQVAIQDGNGCVMNHQVLISAEDQMAAVMRSADNSMMNDNMLVYPNPFNNTFTIKFNETAGDIKAIKLYSLDGRQIQNVELNTTTKDANEIAVNTTEIAPGNYLLKVETINNTYTRLLTKGR